MNTNKFIIGGIIGGIVSFILGWLVWGMLLANILKEHTTDAGNALMRGQDNMVWWALIAGNLFFGFLLSYVMSKGGINSVSGGASTGAVVGLCFAGAMDCFLYAQADLFDTTLIGIDVVANIVVTAVVGAIVGWYFGMGKKAA